jgi:Ca2+-transporting ATPase
LPLILLPVHIAFIELIIDPVCSLAFEAEQQDRDVMARPPRAPGETLLPAWLIGWSLFQGAAAFAAVAGVFFLALSYGLPDDQVRALSFTALVAAIFALVLSARSLRQSIVTAVTAPNWTLVAALGIDTAIVIGIFLTQEGRELFRFAPIGVAGALLAAGMGAGLLMVFELIRWGAARLPATR